MNTAPRSPTAKYAEHAEGEVERGRFFSAYSAYSAVAAQRLSGSAAVLVHKQGPCLIRGCMSWHRTRSPTAKYAEHAEGEVERGRFFSAYSAYSAVAAQRLSGSAAVLVHKQGPCLIRGCMSWHRTRSPTAKYADHAEGEAERGRFFSAYSAYSAVAAQRLSGSAAVLVHKQGPCLIRGCTSWHRTRSATAKYAEQTEGEAERGRFFSAYSAYSAVAAQRLSGSAAVLVH